jgi:hypothetical protein
MIASQLIKMARFLLEYLPMACTTRKHLVVKAASLLATMMLITSLTTGCPIPVQYPLVPDAGNEPPVVNRQYTVPYMVMEAPVPEGGDPPKFTIVVDDPNPGDYLAVKIIKDLHQTWLPQNPTVQHELVLWDRSIGPLDTLAPEDASNMGVSPTTRSAILDLRINPCSAGSAGSEVFLWVCVTDDVFEAPETDYPTEDPCIPKNGFVDHYPVIVTCID